KQDACAELMRRVRRRKPSRAAAQHRDCLAISHALQLFGVASTIHLITLERLSITNSTLFTPERISRRSASAPGEFISGSICYNVHDLKIGRAFRYAGESHWLAAQIG